MDEAPKYLRQNKEVPFQDHTDTCKRVNLLGTYSCVVKNERVYVSGK